jgi:plasmid stabilization system protein ParE
MAIEVYWLEFATDKLDDIYNYYREKAGKRIAQKLINSIIDTTVNLGKQPKTGQIELSLSAREQYFRYLIFKNYKIVYWINHAFERIEIVHVFDTRQNPEKIEETKI